MTFQELKELDSQYVLQTYGRNPIAIDHGRGATLYDVEGKEYIDFASGIGVLSVGTAHPRWQEAIAQQAPLSGHNRPEWDLKALDRLGLRVSAERDIWKQVWTETERINNASTPMFLIQAAKRA